jgi:hypothetical protein
MLVDLNAVTLIKEKKDEEWVILLSGPSREQTMTAGGEDEGEQGPGDALEARGVLDADRVYDGQLDRGRAEGVYDVPEGLLAEVVEDLDGGAGLGRLDAGAAVGASALAGRGGLPALTIAIRAYIYLSSVKNDDS